MVATTIYNTIISVDLICLFVLYVFSKYSVFSHIISSHSSEFVLNFFYLLGIVLNMHFYFTLSYYFESDGQYID